MQNVLRVSREPRLYLGICRKRVQVCRRTVRELPSSACGEEDRSLRRPRCFERKTRPVSTRCRQLQQFFFRSCPFAGTVRIVFLLIYTLCTPTMNGDSPHFRLRSDFCPTARISCHMAAVNCQAFLQRRSYPAERIGRLLRLN